MSHASVIVALSPEQIQEHGGIQEAVSWNMEPFDENGEWFEDGSRWDWWVIGGRYTGKFRPDYDPASDPQNQERCFLCGGTGLRNDDLGRQARADDPSYTCNGCDGKGLSTKFSSKWANVGNVCRRGDLSEQALAEAQRQAAARLWAEWEAESRKDEFTRSEIYGLRPDDTLETLTKRRESQLLTGFAFLKDRRWCEQGRLGWFGGRAPTECEIKALDRGEDYQGRCLHTCPTTGAQIVSWGEDDEDEGRWYQLYWPRFIRSLPPETVLVVVDYHV